MAWATCVSAAPRGELDCWVQSEQGQPADLSAKHDHFPVRVLALLREPKRPADPFRLARSLSMGKMVPVAGIEPATVRLQIGRSTC